MSQEILLGCPHPHAHAPHHTPPPPQAKMKVKNLERQAVPFLQKGKVRLHGRSRASCDPFKGSLCGLGMREPLKCC